jgi:hypothetical protein
MTFAAAVVEPPVLSAASGLMRVKTAMGCILAGVNHF